MKFENERFDEENNEYVYDIEYSKEEYDIFTKYLEGKKYQVKEMEENEIMQIAIIQILKEQIEREENEQKRTEKTDKG